MRSAFGRRAWYLILGFLALVASGAVLLSRRSEPILLVYWTPEGVAYVKTTERLVAAFNSTHPGIEVVHRYFPFETRYSELLRRAFSGTPSADIVLMYGGVAPYAAPGKIRPLPEDRFPAGDLASRFLPAALANRRWQDRYYGLPLEINVESPSLFINRGLIRQLGIELPASWLDRRRPDSWMAVAALAGRIAEHRDMELVRAGLGIVNRQEEAMFLSLIWQFGGDYRDTAGGRFRFATPEARQAMAFMAALVKGQDAVHSYAMPEPMQRFQTGELAMTIGAPWYASEIRPGIDWVCLNLPPFVPGAEPSFLAEGGWGLAVTSTCAHPEAAWEFVDFLAREPQLLAWSNGVDAIPPLRDLDDLARRERVDSRSARTALDVLAAGRDPGFREVDTYDLVWKVVRRNLRAGLQGDMTPEQALTTMEREADALLKP